jgi:hypothetical protein
VELRNEMEKYRLEDPKKFVNVLRALKKYKYDDKRIMAEFSIRRSMKKERMGIEFDRRRLEERIRKVKNVLALAEQLIRFRIGIGEVLAFHSAHPSYAAGFMLWNYIKSFTKTKS